MSQRTVPWSLICASLALAFALTVVPLPDYLGQFRPPWVALLVLYWTLHAPARFGLLGAWISGLLLDALTGATLGQHALALVIPCYLALKMRLRVRFVPLPQQMLTVAALIALYAFVLLWIDGIAGETSGGWARWTPVASAFMVWPFLLLALDTLRSRRRRAS